MRVRFLNIEISFEADSPKEAYQLLAQAMEQVGWEWLPGLAWSSDTYQVDGGEIRDTLDLMEDEGDD